MNVMRICPECHASILDEHAAVCSNCGYPLTGLIQLPDSKSAAGPAPRVGTATLNLSGQQLVQQMGEIRRSDIPSYVSCDACGAINTLGEAVCRKCGASLPRTTAVLTLPADMAGDAESRPSSAEKHGPFQGKLVVYPSGQSIALEDKQGALIVGRSDMVRDIHPDIDLRPLGGDTLGISRRHARIVIEHGRASIEDLHSTNFTYINRQRLTPGKAYILHDGDELRLGLLVLKFQEDK